MMINAISFGKSRLKDTEIQDVVVQEIKVREPERQGTKVQEAEELPMSYVSKLEILEKQAEVAKSQKAYAYVDYQHAEYTYPKDSFEYAEALKAYNLAQVKELQTAQRYNEYFSAQQIVQKQFEQLNK